ncbi:MAG: dihydrofolate reductase [Cytophagales bacterium]
MKVSMIVAASENNVIGKNNELVWHMPADFRYFKEKTKGHIIIMGRKTFESLGKPLKYRTNIIVSKRDNYKPEGTEVFDSIEKALKWASIQGDDEVFIIGGASIYKQSLSIADRIYLTRIHGIFEGDTYFPEPGERWQLISSKKNSSDEKNPYDYTFLVYEKIRD